MKFLTAMPPLSGRVLMALSVLLFAVMDTIIKYLTEGYAVMQIMAVRAPFALLLVVALALANGQRHLFRTRRPGLQILRGLTIFGGVSLIFVAFREMALADAYAVSFVAPIITTLLAMAFLKERIGWRRASAIGLGFVGMLIILRPGGDLFHWAALICLIGTCGYAVGAILSRVVGAEDRSDTTALYALLVMLVLSWVAAPFVWKPLGWADFGLLALTGLLGGLAHITFAEAARREEASVIAPLEYTGLLWVTILGYLVFGDVPGAMTLLGTGFIIAARIIIIRREAAKRPAAAAITEAAP